ncbi:MAG: response regulator [Candidatus Sumerlaeia bacterium]|nr:response regulator [Candidatus Sumerlaeia bacterium]
MPKKILAIDDENDVLLMIKTALNSEGYEVITATNGYDGLAMAEEQHPDLIILDLMMPEMDGFEVLSQLKSNDLTGQIPVIVVSGISDRQKIRTALSKGTDYYIIKPYDYDELINKVRLALGEIK